MTTEASRKKILMGLMIGMIVFSSAMAWGDEDDEGEGWRGGGEEGGWGGGEGEDDGEGRHLLGVQPTIFSKLLTAAGMGPLPTTPSVTDPFLSFITNSNLLNIVETPEVFKVFVKTPGFTSKDTVSAVFENSNLVIRGQRQQSSTDCGIGRRFAEAGGCAPKMLTTFEHSVEWPATITAGLTLDIKSGILTVNVPKTDSSDKPK